MLTQEEELAFSWLRFLHMYTNTHVQASMLIFTLQLIHEILTLTPQKQCKPPIIQTIISHVLLRQKAFSTS